MSPKKILLVAHDVTLAHLGRPLQLAGYLHAAGHDVTLAASSDSARFLHNFPGRTHTLAPPAKPATSKTWPRAGQFSISKPSNASPKKTRSSSRTTGPTSS